MTNIQTVVSNVEVSVFEKMTKAEKFEFISNLIAEKQEVLGLQKEEVAETLSFLQKEQTLIEKKNAKRSAKKSEAQLENEAVREKVLDFLKGQEEGKLFVANTLMEEVGHKDFTSQKATAIMKGLVDEGKVEKVSNVAVVEVVNGKEKKTRKVAYKLV